MNRATNVTVLDVAVGLRSGTADWSKGSTTYTGRIAEPVHTGTGADRITVVTIDQLVARATIRPPSLMKIDVEGSEVEVIDGALKTLTQWSPKLVIATHGNSLRQLVRDRLLSLGYSIESMDSETLVGQVRDLAQNLE